jgi:ABC-type glycerol-3-phosphate transport system substrate-binding protein
MTNRTISSRSLALTGAAFAAVLTLSACGASAEATEPSPGTQPPPTMTTTSTTIVPPPDYEPNDTGSSEDDSQGAGESG